MRYLILGILLLTSGCADREEMHEILKGSYEALHQSSISLKRIATSLENIEAKI